ncbi:MAG: methyltransferase domain-containing protein [Flavihumibacter sp.]
MVINNRLLVNFLKQITINASITDKLKIRYRPYICPFDILLSRVKPGDRLADIGCGSGQFLLLAAHFTGASAVAGIEISPRLIDNARTLFTERSSIPSRFEVFDGQVFPDIIFDADLIFLIDVLHHVPAPNQDTFLLDILKGMKPGSRLLLKDIDAGSPLVYMNKLHDVLLGGGAGHERKPQEIAALLQKGGATIQSVSTKRTWVYPHYIIEATKP